jgi:pimeloyl-ACP methyl ester carboxylesterase
MEMYYEVHGQGEPLVLLHGFLGSASDWRFFTTELASEYRRQPKRVEAMVLVAATPYYPDQARAMLSQLPLEQPEEEWRAMRERHHNGDDQIQALWGQANAFKDSYDDVNFTPPYLSTIEAQTLIIHGDRDPLYPAELALEMYEAIPESYLWVVPNGGHGPIWEQEERTPFVRTSLAFLRGDWAGGRP